MDGEVPPIDVQFTSTVKTKSSHLEFQRAVWRGASSSMNALQLRRILPDVLPLLSTKATPAVSKLLKVPIFEGGMSVAGVRSPAKLLELTSFEGGLSVARVMNPSEDASSVIVSAAAPNSNVRVLDMFQQLCYVTVMLAFYLYHDFWSQLRFSGTNP